MEKVKPTHSDCCKTEIITTENSYGKRDQCSTCKLPIMYGLVGSFHDETMAVCTLHDDTLWFFWQQTSSWDHVLECSQEYIGQIKELHDSLTRRHNMDGDRIEGHLHRAFSNQYKRRVKNPKYAL